MSDIVERLAPCPFCGCTDIVASNVGKDEDNWFVGCMEKDCGVNPGVFCPDSEAAAVAMWNRRSDATITALREEVEEREQRIVERETGRVLRILADEKVKWNDASFETKRLVQSTITEIAATIAASMPVGHSRRRRPRPRQ